MFFEIRFEECVLSDFPFSISVQSKPAYATSVNEVVKDRKKPKPEEPKSSAQSSDSSLAENGVEGKPDSQLNGNKGEGKASNQAESALSNDSKMCNTNLHLNALNADSDCHRDEALGASVLKKEE